MNLIVDFGNTRTKVAIFKDGQTIHCYITEEFNIQEFNELHAKYPMLQKAIISSVRNHSSNLLNFISSKLEYVIELNHHTFLPIQNLYETPETLGKDRIAAAVGANKIYPNQNLLIIDAGTAITYDFVNEKNQYLGGYITPGLQMRFKALNHFTAKLPLLSSEEPKKYDGLNTENSIKGGVQLGLEGEMNRMIEHFSSINNKLTIILSGGDKNYFEKLIKNYKFVALEIIDLGLNTILESNYIRK